MQQQSTVVSPDTPVAAEENSTEHETHPVQMVVSPGKDVMHIGGYETRPSPGKESSHPYEPRPAQLTPTDGSVRSDEGYHSNGYHDDGFTPPEDSSDSDSDNNYVLDFR